MSKNKVKESKQTKAKDIKRDLHDFGAAAYQAALEFYAKHHKSPRALERFMRRLEA